MNPTDHIALLRVIDANANRAAEGLRVVEEYTRFVLDDGHLTRLLKQLRHDLTDVLTAVSTTDRCLARETQQDVGTAVATPVEYRRDTPSDVALANQKRVEQSLRSLEEFFKPIDGEAAARLEQLRYRAYTIGRSIEITSASRRRLERARLYVLLDGKAAPAEFESRVRALIAAGVHVLQLRDKRLGDRELLARARLLRQLTSGTDVLCIVNDRADIARLARADGVHLGQDELPVKEARAVVGADALIGVSTHTIQQARQAVVDGANYIGCGPTFPSRTKSFDDFPGPAFLREVAGQIGLPAFAIGGITAENLPQVMAAGFSRVAVSGFVAAAESPAEAARWMLNELSNSHHCEPAS